MGRFPRKTLLYLVLSLVILTSLYPKLSIIAFQRLKALKPKFYYRPNDSTMKIRSSELNCSSDELNIVKTLNPLVFMAECAYFCNFAPDEIERLLLSSTSAKITNLRVEQRDVDEVGARYNIIEFDEFTTPFAPSNVAPSLDASSDYDCTVNDVTSGSPFISAGSSSTKNIILSSSKKQWIRKRIISIRGSKNMKNYQGAIDNAMECDEFLDMNVHRGFRKVYSAIMKDIPSHILSDDEIPISFTGHSLGGVISCLLAKSFSLRGLQVEMVAAFGMPQFTDRKGSLKLACLPLERVQHLLDPVGMKLPLKTDFVHPPANREIFIVPIQRDKPDGINIVDSDQSDGESKRREKRTKDRSNVVEGMETPSFSRGRNRWNAVRENSEQSKVVISGGASTIPTGMIRPSDPLSVLAGYDRKGRRYTALQIEGMKQKELCILVDSLDDKKYNANWFLENALKFHLKHHSMKKYLDILRQKRDESDFLEARRK